ncbi:hypothetical protein SAMN05446935_6128 [Burkholderia sp. YR290]|nr:hypothetical protein SAMN05446935_6128 [Burkholderia sp. YR290]
MPVKKPDAVYVRPQFPETLDESYPRDGCLITIQIKSDHYFVQIHSPGSNPNTSRIEKETCRTSEQLAAVVLNFATGEPLPWNYGSLGLATDQASGSKVS